MPLVGADRADAGQLAAPGKSGRNRNRRHPELRTLRESIRCVLVHPGLFLATREARRILRDSVKLSDMVWQTANLAGFLSGCYTNDLAMIRDAFEDVVIEPQRAQLIPGFQAVKQAAMANGALGCSISGAGPTVFAWCQDHEAERTAAAMVEAFATYDLASDHWICAIDTDGARVVPG